MAQTQTVEVGTKLRKTDTPEFLFEVIELFTELRDEETEHVEMLREAIAKGPASASEKVEFDVDETPAL